VSRNRPADDPDPYLQVTLRPEPEGLQVTWRMSGVQLHAGQALARIPLSIAGAPTIELEGQALTAADDAGALPLTSTTQDLTDHEPGTQWNVGRATAGPVEVSYLARPIIEEARPATPPLELRREGDGLSGALKCFLALPPGPDDLAFELRWENPLRNHIGEAWVPVCSLGEGLGNAGELTGHGLELLGDTYMMCGELAERHHGAGQMSTWWLTTPAFDVHAFTAQLGRTYELMSNAFGAPARPYRVFLRAHPHRGANASAHPASFVMAMNPDHAVAEPRIYETLAHEIVHEWLHLDGPEAEITWFVEGAADYYSLVLPLREGILDEDAFLRAVNQASRIGYANPRRHLTLHEAQRVFFSDFLAHWLPYVRGMFYLADLDARLRESTSGPQSVDDVVREVVRKRRRGERVGVTEWCAHVGELLPGDEWEALEALAFTGARRPGPGTFAPPFEMTEVDVPVLDLGFDPSTFMTSRVRGLVPGGPADCAGLREGDHVELPSYPEAVALGVEDELHIRVTREGRTTLVDIPLAEQTTPVPQWRKRG
jgi:hypothetical protein